jgi:HSP20 family protein
MAETATKLPVKTEQKGQEKVAVPQGWHPFESLHHEIDRLFDDFGRDFWRNPFRRSAFDIEPFWRREMKFVGAPAVDVAEKDNAYEITADLPGMDEKNIEVKLSNGNLTIKGGKKEEKEEKKKTSISRSAASGRSSAPLAFRTVSTPTRSRPHSRRAC